MVELTKSVLSFSWAMSMFGLGRMGDLLAPSGWNRAAASLDAVTRASQGQMGGVIGSTFQAGDRLQRQLVDMMGGMLSMGGLDPNRIMQLGGGLLQRSMQAGTQLVQSSAQAVSGATSAAGGCGCGGGTSTQPKGGWGPMPPVG